MAILPITGFPATAYPAMPSYSATKLRQFDVNTLPIGRPGDITYGGRSVVDPISASHM